MLGSQDGVTIYKPRADAQVPSAREYPCMPTTVPYDGSNRLLKSLTHNDFELLRPHFRSVSLTLLQPLEVADEVPRDLYFPEGSIASVVATLRSKKYFEVGLIGWEGMTGTSVLSGAPSPFDCYVQFEGRALTIPSRTLTAALNSSQTLRAALALYPSQRHRHAHRAAAHRGGATESRPKSRPLPASADRFRLPDTRGRGECRPR